MCRWIAYIGKPIYMDMVVTRPSHSLIEQSLKTKMLYSHDGSILSTNGDGFGMGWYSEKEEPGLFKVADPAWSNENIYEICSNTKSHLFMAHIRLASAGAIQRSNSHPFKYKNWLFQHNGRVDNYELIRRELQFDIAPELYPLIRGTTDSETFFMLALTYGLETNPKAAVEKMIKRIESACEEKGFPPKLILSCALSDGKNLYTIRYASSRAAHNTQYYSTHTNCIKEINDNFSDIPSKSVVVVSEPLDFTIEHWTEMPVDSFSIIRDGKVESMPLKVR